MRARTSTVDENNIIHCPSGTAWMATIDTSIELSQLVVTMFYASWSASSKVVYDTMVELAKAHPNVMFCKLDIDDDKDTTTRMAVRIVPTLVFIFGGREVCRLKRAASREQIQQKIVSILHPVET